MSTYTRTQVLAYIAAQIADNTSGNVTPAVMRGVLNYMVDQQITPTGVEIPVADEIDMLEGITTMQAAITEVAQKNVKPWASGMIAKAGYMVHHLGLLYYLKNDVDASDTTAPASDTTNYQQIYTAAQIVALLEALTGTDMLDATKIYADYGGASTVQAAITALKALADGAVQDTGNETVAGIKTFSSFPVTPSSAPSNNYEVANKKYVDDTVNDAGAATAVSAYNIDWSLNKIFTKTSSGNPTFTFSNYVTYKEIKFIVNLTAESPSVTSPTGSIITGTESTGYNLVTILCTNAGSGSEQFFIRIEN